MGQYVSKAALVVEIDKRIKRYTTVNACSKESDAQYRIKCHTLMSILSFLDTLEIKDEVVLTDPIKAMTEALRTEYEKGRADVLRVIDPDEMVADFYSQPLSKTRSLASIYRQGIFDIIKRIDNNEETSITSTRSIGDGGMR